MTWMYSYNKSLIVINYAADDCFNQARGLESSTKSLALSIAIKIQDVIIIGATRLAF